MPQQVTITNVAGPGQPWSNDFGTFHPFTLTVDGIDQPVTVNRKPDSPALTVGQQIWLETKPGRNGLAGKIVQAPDGQTSMTPRQNGSPSVTHDDPTRRSIEAQTALKAAVEFHAKDAKAPIDVVQTAAVFADWLGQRS